MLMGKYSRKAVALAGVFAIALIGASAVGVWAAAVDPVATDAALVDPATTMDHDAGVCIGDPLEDSGPAAPPDPEFIPACKTRCNSPGQGCARLSCDPCCWLCGGFVICQ